MTNSIGLLANLFTLLNPCSEQLRISESSNDCSSIATTPKNDLIVLFSLIRRITEIDPVLTSCDQTVNRNFQDRAFNVHI